MYLYINNLLVVIEGWELGERSKAVFVQLVEFELATFFQKNAFTEKFYQFLGTI
jgi:hypothetical protein